MSLAASEDGSASQPNGHYVEPASEPATDEPNAEIERRQNYFDRRKGLRDRRVGMPDLRENPIERRVGARERRSTKGNRRKKGAEREKAVPVTIH